MSTFLLSVGVVVATIAAVLHLALNGPDQPATPRRTTAREKQPSRRARRQAEDAARPAPAPPRVASVPQVGLPAGPALALPDSDAMRLRVLPAAPTTLWVRIRSGVALMVLVAVLGALVAAAVGGLVVVAALLIRSATG